MTGGRRVSFVVLWLLMRRLARTKATGSVSHRDDTNRTRRLKTRVLDMRRNVYVTTALDAYRNFLSDDWGERLDELTADKAKLSEIVFDLMLDWRAAAYTASLPVSILEHMKAFHDGFVNTGELNTTLLHLAQLIPGRLAQELPQLTLDPSALRYLQEKIVDLGAKIEGARDKSQCEFPLEETWQSYLEEHAYQLSLWGSQRICFVSIYNSYENFLVRAVCIAQSIPDCRSNDKEFKEYLVESFGRPLRDKCWTNNNVNIARLARHALSHAGGRVTAKLAKQHHGFVVRDGRIQVTPEKTRALFLLLRDCVYSLAEKAVTMPEFESP